MAFSRMIVDAAEPGNQVAALNPTPNPLPASKEGAHRLFLYKHSPSLLAGKGLGEGVRAPYFHNHATSHATAY